MIYKLIPSKYGEFGWVPKTLHTVQWGFWMLLKNGFLEKIETWHVGLSCQYHIYVFSSKSEHDTVADQAKTVFEKQTRRFSNHESCITYFCIHWISDWTPYQNLNQRSDDLWPKVWFWTTVTLTLKDPFVQVPWKYIKVCGYWPFFKNLNQRSDP